MTARTLVAIVDDEESIRRALARLLRVSGLEACAFASGQEFLDSLDGGRPDCVLLDMNMPGLTGLEVLKALMAAGEQLPVVIVTAYDEPNSREQCLAAGAASFLLKPLDRQVILDAIAAAIESQRARRARAS